MLKYNNRAQMLMVGILILVMTILVFISMLPAVQNIMDESRGCSNLNCAGFVDADASTSGCGVTNQSYDSDLNENSLTCTIMDLFLPFLILGVLIALITKLLHGGLVDSPQPQYGQYPGQY